MNSRLFCVFRLPFDWKSSTPSYFVAVAFEMAVHTLLMTWMLTIICLMIGFVSFVGLYAEQLKSELKQLDLEDTDESQLNTTICNIIELHCEAKQYGTLN